MTAPQTNWTLLGVMAVPSSPELGPAVISRDFGECYAHNPGGALVALANFTAELATTRVDQRPRLIEARVAREQGYQQALDAARQAASRMTSDLPPGAGVNDQARLQFTAFRWVDYTPKRAVVTVVYRMTASERAGAMASATYTLTWDGQDWKIVYPGSGRIVFEAVPELAGFTLWSGV